jgi:hypothetical protein
MCCFYPSNPPLGLSGKNGRFWPEILRQGALFHFREKTHPQTYWTAARLVIQLNYGG